MARETANKLNKSWLNNVPEDKVFWCHDGTIIKNMDELALALKQMSDESYFHHANNEKNDFSNWVKDVIGDNTLAGQLTKVTGKNNAARSVDMRLSSLRASR